jgi:hypothetical protein
MFLGSGKSYDADSIIQAAADRQDNSRRGQNARKSHLARRRVRSISCGATWKRVEKIRPAKAGLER